MLSYHYDDHPDLDSLVQILENVGAIRDITHNNVKRYVMLEGFADYLRPARDLA